MHRKSKVMSARPIIIPVEFLVSNFQCCAPLELKNQRHPRKAFSKSMNVDGKTWNNCVLEVYRAESWQRELLAGLVTLALPPLAQVGHEHRAPRVCGAVPAAVLPAAQRQCVWAGRACAPAVPARHGLEDLAHLHPGCSPNQRERPILLISHSEGYLLSFSERNLQSEENCKVTYRVCLLLCCPIYVWEYALVLEVYKLTVLTCQFFKTVHLKNIYNLITMLTSLPSFLSPFLCLSFFLLSILGWVCILTKGWCHNSSWLVL